MINFKFFACEPSVYCRTVVLPARQPLIYCFQVNEYVSITVLSSDDLTLKMTKTSVLSSAVLFELGTH